MIVILSKLFLTFAKIGLIGFGGGLAILPLIYQGMQSFGTIAPEEFAELFAISQATPGPMAVNAATFAGFETAGVPGALAATLGVALPAFVLIGICVKFLNRYQDHKLVKGAFVGIRPVAVGMIMAGFVMVGQTSLFYAESVDWNSLNSVLEGIKILPAIMAVATFVLAKHFKVGSIKLIIIMGVCGAIFCSGLI